MKHCSGLGVSYGVVAAQAANPIGIAVVADINGLNNTVVASPASVFRHIAAGAADLDVVGKISSCEIKRMKEAVAGFYSVFTGKVMGSMAIITGGSMLVASLDPAIVLRIHHMAVRTSLGIIGEIGIPLGVNEGVTAKANHGPCKNGEQ